MVVYLINFLGQWKQSKQYNDHIYVAHSTCHVRPCVHVIDHVILFGIQFTLGHVNCETCTRTRKYDIEKLSQRDRQNACFKGERKKHYFNIPYKCIFH